MKKILTLTLLLLLTVTISGCENKEEPGRKSDIETVVVDFIVDGQTVDTVTGHKGMILPLPELTLNSGDTIEGWYTDIEFTDEYNFDDPFNADTTLYGKVNEQ